MTKYVQNLKNNFVATETTAIRGKKLKNSS